MFYKKKTDTRSTPFKISDYSILGFVLVGNQNLNFYEGIVV
jgi:hypothetical protein